ncbi:MAG: MMPL family transporter [bacterium]|nr:MMPL family transporter [bacterium]
MKSNPFRRLADWEIRHRRWVVLGLVLVSVFALAQLPRLRFDFRPEALLEFSPEERAFAEDFNQRFGIHDNLLLIALQGTGPGSVTDARGLTLLYRLTEAAGASGISREAISLVKIPRRDLNASLSIFGGGALPPLVGALPVTGRDVARVRSQIETSRMLPRQLVSEDGSTAAIVVALAEEFQDLSALDRPLAELETAMVEILRTESNDAVDARDYELHLGGLPFVRLETVRNLKSEQRRFWPLTAVLYLALMWLLYRDVGLTLAPLVAVGLASLWGIALLPLVGSEVNVVNNIVPSLILVIGVCNAIHMLHAYAAGRRRGLDGQDAVREMMAELGLPVFLTSLTTAIGFASLLVARNGTLRDLGWQAAAGIMMSYLALITFLPVVVGHFGNQMSGNRMSGESRGLWRVQTAQHRWLDSLVSAINRRPRWSLALALGALALALASGARVPVDSLVLDTFPPGHPIYESNKVVEQKLGGILPLELQLMSSGKDYFTQAESLRQVFQIQRDLARQPGVLDVKSLVDLIAEVHGKRADDEVEQLLTPERVSFALGTLRRLRPEALTLFLSEDHSETRVAARLGDHGIRASLATLDWIEEATPGWLEPFDAPVTLRMTGEAYIASRGLDFFIRDLILSLLTAGGVIFLVLVLVFRSPRMGLLSFLPTVLPLALTLGLMPLYGYELNTSTVVVFTISIGMAVDNTIHLLTHFRRARRSGMALDDAIHHTFRRAGAAVVASNLLLIGGFSILFTSGFDPVFRVAALTTTTIAAAMLAAMLVLPQLLTLWGRPIGKRA